MTREQLEQDEREQAARVLPAMPFPELTPDRVYVHRQHLLDEIDRQTDATAPRRAPRFRRRTALPRAAATAVATTVVVVSLNSGESSQVVPPASAASVQLLQRAALAAASQPAPTVRAGQYTYVKVTGYSTVLSEGDDGKMERLRQDESMEQWTSVDGGQRTLQRTGDGDTYLPDLPGKGNLNSPTYDFLVALPNDPDALLKKIYQQTEAEHGFGSGSTTGPDQEAFVTIGDLLRDQVAPPETTSALYRAAARIPGVITVSDAVDAAGRHGVAVAREHDDERTEWIFDASTAQFLGERTVQLKNGPWGEAGAVVTSVAVVTSGVVDKAGQAS
jgi:hypothetical protein